MVVLYYGSNTGFKSPFSEMSTDLDEIWQTSVDVWSTLVGDADDKALMANSWKGLQQLMLDNGIRSPEFGMKINVKNTNVMCISQMGNNQLKIYTD